MNTEDLCDPFLLILCFMPTNTQIIPSSFIPISKNYFHVTFQNVSFLLRSKKASFLFCSKIDNSFLASLWFFSIGFVNIQHITLQMVVLLIKQYFKINMTNNLQRV